MIQTTLCFGQRVVNKLQQGRRSSIITNLIKAYGVAYV